MKVNNTGRAPKKKVEYKMNEKGINTSSRNGMHRKTEYSGDEMWLKGTDYDASVEPISNGKIGDGHMSPEVRAMIEKEKQAKEKAEEDKKKKQKPKGKKQMQEKVKKEKKPWSKKKKIFMAMLLGLLVLVGVGLFMRFYLFPGEMKIDKKTTGLYRLNSWNSSVASLNEDSLKADLGGAESYLGKELDYAGDSTDRADFMVNMAGTVKYVPAQVPKKDKLGRDMKRKGQVILQDSWLTSENEPVELQYIDYSKIKFSDDEISKALKKDKVSVDDENYKEKLTTVFCKLMNSKAKKGYAIKTDKKYVPHFNKVNGGYLMAEKEDITIDSLLFSSKAFDKLVSDFSLKALELQVGAGGGKEGEETEEWKAWNELSADEKKDKEEPPKYAGKKVNTTKEWEDWNKLDKEKKEKVPEPEKYDAKYMIGKEWCGAHRLMTGLVTKTAGGKEVKFKVSAKVGDGSFKTPAGMSTEVVSYASKNGGKIKIRLIDFGVSKEAIDWLESKDVRNKGLEIKSPLQYCYAVFEVTNLTGKDLNLKNNSSLADKNGNPMESSGSMFGLQDELNLKPDETGVIETWGSSTELNKRYLIWGMDFDGKKKPVYFRVLAGNIDDTSVSKGVYGKEEKQK